MSKNKINNLNKKLELQELIKESDGAGGYKTEWKTIKTIWGDIKLISNYTNTNYSMLELKATHIITVRSFNNINNNMRFIYNDNIYIIKYINDLNNNFTEIICEC